MVLICGNSLYPTLANACPWLAVRDEGARTGQAAPPPGTPPRRRRARPRACYLVHVSVAMSPPFGSSLPRDESGGWGT